MYTIIGLSFIDYERDGRRVNGTRIYATYNDDRVIGQACDSVYVPSKVRNGADFQVGQNCKFYYDKYGKIADVIIEE